MIIKILLLPLVIVAVFAMCITPIALFSWIGITVNELAEKLFFKKDKPLKYWITTLIGWYFAILSAVFMYALFYHILVFMGM